MIIEKVDYKLELAPHMPVKLKEMGNIKEIMYCSCKNEDMKIRLIDKDHYVILETGEIKECNHIQNRSENLNYMRQSFKKLRDLLNTNIVDVEKCKSVTLTYGENMMDSKKLKNDFKKFNMKLRYKYGNYDFITIAEPQGRGAWHLHVIMIFPVNAPYIPKKELQNIWGHGVVWVEKVPLKSDNLGAYFTAYIGNVEVDEAMKEGLMELNVAYDFVESENKRYVKGLRLKMYPPKFRLYRYSKGIKQPIITEMFEGQAQKKVSDDALTFEKTIEISDENRLFKNIINYRYYNSKRATSQ